MDFSWFYARDAAYVVPYGTAHVVYLFVCFAVIFLFVSYRDKVVKHRDTVRKVFLGILLFQQIVLLYGWYAVFTGFDLSESLPLHICRIASLLTILLLWKKDMRYMDVIFYFSVFALGSLFYPKNVYHFGHINGISYMINHLMTVLIPIFGAVAYGWRASWHGFRVASLAFVGAFAFVYWLNPILGSNYFYLIDRPFFSGLSYPAYALLCLTVTVGGYALITAALVNLPAYLRTHAKHHAVHS